MSPITLNELLAKANINPSETLVLRHRPTEPTLARVLPWLAAERRTLYDAYQSTQGDKLERAMQALPWLVSCIANGAGQALFVGLYRIGDSRPVTREQFWSLPEHIELKGLGMRGFRDPTEDPRETILQFDTTLEPFLSDWRGKLILSWPPPERSWWRRAHRNDMGVQAILQDPVWDKEVGDWRLITLSWAELRVMPGRLRAALEQWRGIYLIRDESDGRAYVGSAAGQDNILGRWQNYAATGHGGNALLRGRDPSSFRFSILERVSPDMPVRDVVEIETSWKIRLATRGQFGLNEN